MASQAMQDFARMPNQRKALMFGIVIMLGSALYWQFGYKGLKEDVEAAEAEHTAKVSQNDKLGRDIPAYEKLKEKFGELQRIVGENQKALPTEAEIPAFFETLNRKVKDSGVEIKSWAQGKEEPVETFVKVPVKMEITGTYLQIKRFFASLVQKKDEPVATNASEPKERERIVSIEGLALGDVKRRSNEWVMTAKFTATTFRQDEVKAPTTMTPGGAPPPPTNTNQPPPMPSTGTPAGAKAKTDAALQKGDTVNRGATGVDEAKTPAGSGSGSQRLKGGL